LIDTNRGVQNVRRARVEYGNHVWCAANRRVVAFDAGLRSASRALCGANRVNGYCRVARACVRRLVQRGRNALNQLWLNVQESGERPVHVFPLLRDVERPCVNHPILDTGLLCGAGRCCLEESIVEPRRDFG